MPSAAKPPTISYCKIFPSIGIARLGNSPEEWFIGPEIPGRVPEGGGYKDDKGRVKRQAARFRLYAFDEHDGVVAELTVDHPEVEEIRWTVELANKKAEWFQFNGSAAVARILRGETQGIARRNSDITKADHRRQLVIGPVRESVAGREQASGPLEGTFLGLDGTVVLGDLRTDLAGRLLVLGGHGRSQSVADETRPLSDDPRSIADDSDNPLVNYANNDRWFDDTSDGPVTASVTLKGGRTLEVRGRGWVIAAAPHYSPHTENIVTLYEAMGQAARNHQLPWREAEHGPPPSADPVSFTRDIEPILRRLTMYQWVNRRAQRGHSPGRPGDFLDPETLELLANPEVARRPGSPQKRIFAKVRRPLLHEPVLAHQREEGLLLDPASYEAIGQANLTFMPPLSGDESDTVMGSPTSWLSVTELQYRRLSKWKDGDFLADWTGAPAEPPGSLEDIELARRPAALTRAALEHCQGGAFFPGIEITSILRFDSFYSEPYRVSDKYEPGDITRWMALPWQADFYLCADHWWPAIRPDDVVPVGDFEKVVAEFRSEVERKDLATLLVARQPWARGVGMELPGRPVLPSPGDGQSAADHRDICRRRLRRFRRRFLGVLSRQFGQLARNEGPERYRRRLEEFLDKTILETPEFRVPAIQAVETKDPQGNPVVRLETSDEYVRRVRAAIVGFLDRQVEPPAPDPGESVRDYAQRLTAHADKQAVWHGLMDVEWRARVSSAGMNDMVDKWHRLGFVVPRTTPQGETVYVESERGPYELLPFRDYFYHLMNIDEFPDFVPKARALAEEFLRLAREAEQTFIRDDPTLDHYTYFNYSPETFRARLEKIYETERRSAAAYNPVTGAGEPLFHAPAHVVERIRQLAPFNQLDGSWLEKTTRSGPIDEISSFLFEIWSDEIGNGDPAQNHANVYTDLMHSAGIYVPPLNSRAYADNPEIWDGSFSSPVYQAAIGHFPEAYFPELLGMTLYLEWEAVYLPAMVRLYEYHGYNALFYRLHVAIDNPVNGHGARARDAVSLYLDHIRSESGPAEMQDQFRRIWTGYLAFKFVGADEFLYRFTNPPTLDDQMLEMLARKRHFAQLNHGVKRFGVNSLNDWFDESEQFLDELGRSDLITRGDARNSKIIALMRQPGPMLKVFSQKEITLWAQWINELPPDPLGGALAPGRAMELLLRELRSRGIAVPAHQGYVLSGRVPDPVHSGEFLDVTRPVSWWFELAEPSLFMEALRDPRNGWIVPGNVAGSRMVTELLSGNGAMTRVLRDTVPEAGDKTARQLIIQWIELGCPLPEPEPPAPEPPGRLRAVADAATPGGAAPPGPLATATAPAPTGASAAVAEVVRRSLNSVRLSPGQREGLRRRFIGPRGGACH